MKLRTLVVTIVALAVLSAIVALVRRPTASRSTDPKIGQDLVGRPTIEKAAKLRLSDQGKSVMLMRQSDGSWRNSSYFDLPADFQKLSRLVDDLTQARLQRLVTSNPERIARLEFKDTKIELLDAADKELWSVTLGKNAESGGRFVRFGSEPKAYLANLNTWIDAEPKNWADAGLLKLKADDIAKLELVPPATAPAGDVPPPTETLVVSRAKKEDPWTPANPPANQKLKTEKVGSLVSALTSLRFTDTTELGDPKVATARQHLRTYKLTTFDGKTYTVSVGQKPEEKKLKPPTPATDGKSGPAALGTLGDVAKADFSTPAPDNAGANAASNPLAPEFETIPAGPAFVTVTASDTQAPINEMMQKRAFQVAEYTVTSLPQTAAELFEPAPAAPPASAVAPAASSAPAPQAASGALPAGVPAADAATSPAAPAAPKSAPEAAPAPAADTKR